MPSENPSFRIASLRLIGNFHDPERERMEIQQQMSISDQPAVRNMRIAYQHVSASVYGCISPGPA